MIKRLPLSVTMENGVTGTRVTLLCEKSKKMVKIQETIVCKTPYMRQQRSITTEIQEIMM